MWPFVTKKAITPQQESLIVNAIKEAERNTSGEIRVHFDNSNVSAPIERAKQVFVQLKMHETKLRNGILFYVNLKQKQFAVWGDEGINAKVPSDVWDQIRDTAIEHFKQDKFAEGMEACILMCGRQLKDYFPSSNNDINELTNDISYQK